MRKLCLLTIFTLIFALAGCGDSACYNKLKEVDSLSEKDLIDSAQKVLETIEQSYKIKNGKDKAYYSLLKYQLQFRFQFKNNSYSVNDSLIDYSIAYYTKHTDMKRLALCYYLKGRTKDNICQSKEAIKYFKKAEFTIKDYDDDFLKMRIYDIIAKINFEQENYTTACEYGNKAIKYGEKTNELEGLIWCYLRLSATYGNLENPDSSLFYATKCLEFLESAPDEQKSIIYINVAGSLIDIDSVKAKEYALKSLEIEKSNNAYQILAKIARDNKDYKLSETYLNEALKYSTSVDWDAFILYELEQTKTLLGKHEEAAKIAKEVHRMRDSAEYIYTRDSIKELQLAADLNHQNLAVVKKKDNRTAIIAVTLTAIILITTGAYVRKRRKLKRTLTDSEQKEDEYKNQIKTIEEENKKKEKEIETAKRKAEAEARKAEKARKEKEAAKKEKDSFIKATIKQQEKMKADEEKRMSRKEERCRAGMDIYNKVAAGTGNSIYWDKETEMSFVEYYQLLSPKFKNDIDTKYIGMTERKLVILALKDMGQPNAIIAKLLNISEGAVRTQLSRMNKGTKDDMTDE